MAARWWSNHRCYCSSWHTRVRQALFQNVISRALSFSAVVKLSGHLRAMSALGH